MSTESAEGGSGGESAGQPDLPVPHDTASGGDAEPGSGGLGGAGEGGQPGLEACAERTQICPAASVCNDGPEGAICSYPIDLGMVAYIGNDIDGGASLVVVPLSPALPEPVRLDWSAGAEEGKFVMPWRPSWAPNGQALTFYLTAADFLSDFSQRFYWVDLSLPAPLTAMRIPNIPVKDDFSSTLWSPNSRRLLIQQTAGVFVVDFADGRATTERVGEEGASLTDLAFCADGSLVYNQDGVATIAPALDEVPTQLEQTVVSVSPGGRWLLLSDGTTDYVAACAAGATPRSLQPAPSGFGADWSPNGDDLALADSDSEPVVRSVWRFEKDDEPRLLQQVSTSARDVAWQPAGARLLYQSWQNDAAGTFHVLDLTAEPADRVLPIAPELAGDDNAFEVSWVAQSSKVRWTYFDEDLERHDFLLDLAAADDPVALGGTTPDWFSSDGEQALSIEQLDEGSQVWLSQLSKPAERQPLFPEPLPCYLLVKDLLPGAAPFLECTDADERTTFYAVADDLHSALQISDGTYVDDPVLRPRP